MGQWVQAEGNPVIAQYGTKVADMQDGGSCGAEPFALRVIGDSMSPEFKDGCIIIIDPEGVICDGSYVLVRHEDEYIFRQLVYGDGTYRLEALQEGYETIVMPNLDRVAGVIVQQAGRRRADRKHYV
jgi:SOS-response transcriptional repressor LexA